MEMLIRKVALYLNWLRYRVAYRKRIWFRGFCVIYAFRGSGIQFDNVHGGG